MRPFKVNRSYCIGFSPSGAECFTLARDVSLWDIGSRKKSWRSHPFSHPSDAAFSPEGNLIAVKSTSGRIVILASDTGQVLKDFDNNKEGEGSNLVFSVCGHFIVDGSWDGLLTVRDVSSGAVRYRREHEGEMISRVQSVRGGAAWIVEHMPKATADGRPPADGYFTVSPWPLSSGAINSLGIRLPSICASAASQDGLRLAVLFGAPPRELRVYELPSERIMWESEVTIGGSGSALCWSGCGRFLASVQKDSVVHYNGMTGEHLAKFALPLPSDADYSPDTRLIGLGSWQSGEVRTLPCAANGKGEPDSAAKRSQPVQTQGTLTPAAPGSGR